MGSNKCPSAGCDRADAAAMAHLLEASDFPQRRVSEWVCSVSSNWKFMMDSSWEDRTSVKAEQKRGVRFTLSPAMQYSYAFLSCMPAGTVVPYREHESGYGVFILLAAFKTIMSVHAAWGICRAKTSVFVNALLKGLRRISKSTRHRGAECRSLCRVWDQWTELPNCGHLLLLHTGSNWGSADGRTSMVSSHLCK